MRQDVSDAPIRHSNTTQEPSAVPFTLTPGDIITDCSPLRVVCDRVAEELGKCQACGKKTFRVVTIRSAANLERKSALCGRHLCLQPAGFLSSGAAKGRNQKPKAGALNSCLARGSGRVRSVRWVTGSMRLPQPRHSISSEGGPSMDSTYASSVDYCMIR